MAFVEVDLFADCQHLPLTLWRCLTCLQTYVDNQKALEVLVWLRDKALAVGAEDPAMTVVNVTVRQLLALWSVELDSLVGDCLPWGQRERAGFNGVCRCHDLMCSRQLTSCHSPWESK